MILEGFFCALSRLLEGAVFGLGALSHPIPYVSSDQWRIVSAEPFQIAALEPERVSPQNTLDLPPVSARSGNSTFLQYDYLAKDKPCTPVVVLDVPKAFAPRSPAGPTKAWQVLLLVRFRHEDNAIEAGTPELFGCVGHCNGRMTLSIGNGLGEKWNLAQRAFRAAIADYDRLKQDDRFSTEEQFDPKLGYEKGIYVKRNPHADTEYFSDADDADKVTYALRCNPHVPVPGCWARFSIPNYRWIDVTLTFDMLDLPIWGTIRESSSRFVESMVREIVSPLSCKQD